ncbi:YybH family protein [Methylococcus capsulatus]|uniref:SgcJ/EcaC family oxidoreductase n=1 Tax=Methylococcus capsulatus TaxID=414 RepID=A0ABZ2F9P4_METCP|nr:SgcJ/EcaC family oxidoreductase [Methylococcus capsulatus]MDF9392903.1 SgcJ/EcaC family oxidoreductase [Methylococcus capsulatus]
MTEDEQAIREVVATWMRASQAGDTPTVLSLMTEDAVFMVPSQEPFGRETFEASANQIAAAGLRIDATYDIVELQVWGDWAFTRNRIDLSITPPAGEPVRRAGYTLTLFRKEGDGCWRIARDANLLALKT